MKKTRSQISESQFDTIEIQANFSPEQFEIIKEELESSFGNFVGINIILLPPQIAIYPELGKQKQETILRKLLTLLKKFGCDVGYNIFIQIASYELVKLVCSLFEKTSFFSNFFFKTNNQNNLGFKLSKFLESVDAPSNPTFLSRLICRIIPKFFQNFGKDNKKINFQPIIIIGNNNKIEIKE